MKLLPILFLVLVYPATGLMGLQSPAEEPAEEEAVQRDEGEEGEEPVLTQREVLYVEEQALPLPTTSSIATKLEVPLRQTPASISVVTGSLLGEQGGIILGDALKNVSGAGVHTNFGVHDFFLLRGFDSLATGLVLTDGAMEPEATFYQLYNVDQIEVLKGPGGFLYGGNPMSGVVNLARKQPQQDRSLNARLEAGSYETYRGTVDLNLGRQEGPLAFRLNALWSESDHYRDDKASEAWGVNPALTWWLDADSALRFNVEFLSNDFSPDAGLPVAGDHLFDVPRTRSYQSPFDFSDQDVHRLRLDYETSLGDTVTLRNKAYYTDLDWRSNGTVFVGVLPTPEGSAALLRTLLFLDDRQRFLGNQFEVFLSPGRQNLLFGLEVESNRDDFTIDVGLLPTIDIFDPVERATEPVFILPGLGEVGDTRTQVVAPYVLDRVELSERVQLFVGGRLDVIEFDNDATATSRDADRLSPLLGLVFSPTDRVSVYANFGRAFAPPSTRVVGEQRPEESEQAEVGIKGGLLAGSLQGGLSLYYLERENIPILDDSGFTAQEGSQRSRGVELEVAGTPLPGMHYQLSYGFTDAELTEFNELVLTSFIPPSFTIVDRSGNDPAFAPGHILNFWLAKRFRNGFSVGGGGRWVSEQFIAEDNVFKIDDALTFDASFAYRLAHWSLSLNLKNFTDEKYETRGFGANSIIPATPATIHAGVEFRN